MSCVQLIKMKKLFPLIISILSLNANCQPKDLEGFWILERTVYENGMPLEINHPLYSSFVSYEFEKKSVKISDTYFDDVKYTQDYIDVGFRKINYKFQDGSLILQDMSDDMISIYSKFETYLDNHPEFLSRLQTDGEDTLLLSNPVIEPKFNHKSSFDDFMRDNIGEYTKQHKHNILFKARYTLTKENKIKDIEIIKGISKKFDQQFIKALLKAEKYLENRTNYDILLEHKFNFFKMHNYWNSPNAKTFGEVHYKAEEYFELNQFKQVIDEYSKIDMGILDNQIDRFKGSLREAYLNIVISYLALNDKEKACEVMSNIGDKTNFYVRNYIIDFCEN